MGEDSIPVGLAPYGWEATVLVIMKRILRTVIKRRLLLGTFWK